MNAELEALLKADEEARVRIDSAQAEADAAVRKAEKDCAQQRSSRLEQLRADLGEEVREIQQQAEELTRKRRAERQEYLRRITAAADSRKERALSAYIEILERGEVVS